MNIRQWKVMVFMSSEAEMIESAKWDRVWDYNFGKLDDIIVDHLALKLQENLLVIRSIDGNVCFSCQFIPTHYVSGAYVPQSPFHSFHFNIYRFILTY